VRFRKDRFDHCFFESSQRNQEKDEFSESRAERIDWIKSALQDDNADLYVGWDRKKKTYDNTHRVIVAVDDYVVVIRLTGEGKANFVTAYVADSKKTIDKIKESPRWHQSKKNR